MLERYYLSRGAVKRIRALWLGPAIDRYAVWLAERQAPINTGRGCIGEVIRFNRFVQSKCVRDWSELPAYVQPFVAHRVRSSGRRLQGKPLRDRQSKSRSPVMQLLRLLLPGYGVVEPPAWPFASSVPGFASYLQQERGLQPVTIRQHAYHLRALEHYLKQTDTDVSQLTPALITQFLLMWARKLHPRVQVSRGCVLRVFLRYLYREQILGLDLSGAVARGRHYLNADIPRALPWKEVERALASVDRRSCVGKRDYAILMLLATYGLRANDVASLKLDDIDWRNGKIRVTRPKAGNCTAYPLCTSVGDALVTYLQHARPQCADRHVFLTCLAPYRKMAFWAVAHRAAYCLQRIGVKVHRAGSHTFRHSCAQRLVEADLPLKHIADYIGHRSEERTLIYAKVAVHKLRELVVGEAEDML